MSKMIKQEHEQQYKSYHVYSYISTVAIFTLMDYNFNVVVVK